MVVVFKPNVIAVKLHTHVLKEQPCHLTLYVPLIPAKIVEERGVAVDSHFSATKNSPSKSFINKYFGNSKFLFTTGNGILLLIIYSPGAASLLFLFFAVAAIRI